MTVDRDDKPDDDVLASLARLRACDVSQRRSRQLRRRCHAVLQADPAIVLMHRAVLSALPASTRTTH